MREIPLCRMIYYLNWNKNRSKYLESKRPAGYPAGLFDIIFQQSDFLQQQKNQNNQ